MKRMLFSVAALTAVAAPAMAETWVPYANTTNNALMAEADGVVTVAGVARILVATVPLRGDAGDYSHTVETYEFQCGANRWRTAGVVEHGPDGAEADRFPEEGAAWEPVRSRTTPEYLKSIACEGSRTTVTWPTIKAFVDAGRPVSS